MQSSTPHDSTPNLEPSANESPHRSPQPLASPAPVTLVSPHHLPLIATQAAQFAHIDTADTQQLYENNIQTEESLTVHYSNVSAHQETPNESAFPNMISKSQKARNKTLGAFQPKDTLNDPPSYAGCRSDQPHQQSTDSNSHRRLQLGALASETNFSHQTRAKSTGPGLLASRPDVKRQRLDSHGTRQSRGISQPVSDDYPVPSHVQHISSHSAKRASRDSEDIIFNGSVPSYRDLMNKMRPSRATKIKQAASSTQKSHAHLPTTPDNDEDFEMSGMPKEPRELQQDDHGKEYAEKSVAVSRNGGLKIYLGSLDEPSKDKMDDNDQSVSKSIQRGSRERTNSPELPPATHHKSVEDEPMENPVSSDDTQEALPRSRRAHTSSPKRRTVGRDDNMKSPSSDEDPDKTDELQKDLDESPSGPSVDKIRLAADIPSGGPSPSAKHKPLAPEPGDGFNDHEKMTKKVSSMPTIPTKKERARERAVKESLGMSLKETRPLVAYYKNSQDFTGPLRIHFDQGRATFKVVHGSDDLSLISLEDVQEVNFSSQDDARYAQLKGARSGSVTLKIFFLFESLEDMQWFRQKVYYYTNVVGKVSLKLKNIDDGKLEKIYNNLHGGSSESQSSNIDYQLENSRTTRSGANRRNTDRNGPTDGLQKSQRFRPYTEAVKKMGGVKWEKPLQYPLGAIVKDVATLDKQDIKLLEPDEFLNDNLIWFGLKHAMENRPESKKQVHCFNTYFYNALTRDGKARGIDYDSVKRWTAKQGVNLFKCDYVIVPINHALHWYVAIICNLKNMERRTSETPEITSTLRGAVSPGNSPSKIEFGFNDEARQPTSDDDRDDQQKAVVEGVSQMSLLSDAGSEDDLHENEQPSQKIKFTSSQANKSEHEPALAPGNISQGNISRAMKSPAVEKNDPTQPRIITLDSLDTSHPEVVKSLREYLKAEAQNKLGAEITLPGGTTVKNIPFQPNYCDCGLYLIEYVKRFLDDPDTFIEKVLTRQMGMNYWPNTVAEDLRDDFRELVLEEGCKQNGISPAQEPTDGCVPDDVKLEKSITQESAGTRSKERKATNSPSASPNVNGSEKSPVKSRIHLLSSNKLEAPICDESSLPSEQGIPRKLRKRREDSKKPHDLGEEVSRTEALPSRRNQFTNRTIYLDETDEDERPATRGKQI